MLRRLALGLLTFGLSAPALAETPVGYDEDDPAETITRPGLTHDLLDPEGRTRFHLITRLTPSTGEGKFTNDLRATIMARAHIQVFEGLAVNAALPAAGAWPDPGADAYLVGNIRLGVEGGHAFYVGDSRADAARPRIALGGAFDLYLPTAATADNAFCGTVDACDGTVLVRDLNAYEPESFIDDALMTRLRFHADFSMASFTAGLELSLSPGLTLDTNPEFIMLFGWMVRGAVAAGPYLEPFVEIGSSRMATGPSNGLLDLLVSNYTTPTTITLGARAHLGGFDPALFLSVDARDGYLIFGLDLASVFATDRRSAREAGETRDFLRGFD
ncbi:MAG: hypothetical protein KC933_19270 [Myxococcales bacterium]|nr:hypothetical protein [Myxococcales bacterium]